MTFPELREIFFLSAISNNTKRGVGVLANVLVTSYFAVGMNR